MRSSHFLPWQVCVAFAAAAAASRWTYIKRPRVRRVRGHGCVATISSVRRVLCLLPDSYRREKATTRWQSRRHSCWNTQEHLQISHGTLLLRVLSLESVLSYTRTRHDAMACASHHYGRGAPPYLIAVVVLHNAIVPRSTLIKVQYCRYRKYLRWRRGSKWPSRRTS